MTEINVSVIIPVYNTALYVGDAVNSIIQQTLHNIEVIIINDGSTDNSLEIINELAATDSRIHVFSQINKGLSETRNRGIQLARGKYIYFMDSDDLLAQNALEECYNKCEQEKLDFVIFDAEVFGESVSTLNLNYHRGHLIKEGVYPGISLLEHLLYVGGYQPSACLSFINSAFLAAQKLSFYPGILHEDELFTFLLYANAKRVASINKAYFRRRLRHNSIMVNEFSHKSLEGYVTVMSQLIKIKKGKEEDKFGKLVDKRVTDILGGVLYNSRGMKLKDRYLLALRCVSQFRPYITIKGLMLLTLPVSRYLKKGRMALIIIG